MAVPVPAPKPSVSGALGDAAPGSVATIVRAVMAPTASAVRFVRRNAVRALPFM